MLVDAFLCDPLPWSLLLDKNTPKINPKFILFISATWIWIWNDHKLLLFSSMNLSWIRNSLTSHIAVIHPSRISRRWAFTIISNPSSLGLYQLRTQNLGGNRYQFYGLSLQAKLIMMYLCPRDFFILFFWRMVKHKSTRK